MCWFITIGVNVKGAAALEALGRERAGLGVRPSTNPFVAALFPKDDVRFEETHGGCSCDLVPGGGDPDGGKSQKMRRRYKAQGWSDAKIARAVQAAESAHSASTHRRENSGPKVLLRNTVIDQVRRLGSVRLFAYFYSRSQDEEHVACTNRRRIIPEEFLAGEFPEDVLVEIVA